MWAFQAVKYTMIECEIMAMSQQLPTFSGSLTRQKCLATWNNKSKTKPYPQLEVGLFRREMGDMTFHQNLLTCWRGSILLMDGLLGSTD